MKKILLSLITAVTALSMGYAKQSVTLDFSHASHWTAVGEGDSIRTNNKIGWNGEFTISQNGLNVPFKSTSNAYFICTKTDTAFFIGAKDSYIKTPVVDFKVGSIDVVFGSGVSTAVTVDYFVGDKALGQTPTITKGGTATWTVPADLTAVGTQYALKITNTKNLQVSKIIINEFEAPEVSAPVITPASGTYPTAQTVTITAAEGCTIYYTLDGTDPNDASAQYTAPFEVKESTVVKAIAYNEEDCGSEIAVSDIMIGYLNANFKTDQQGWTIDNKNVPEGKEVWAQDAKYGMKATGYIGGKATETESWLVSPAIDLTEAVNPALTISHAANYFTNPTIDKCVSVLVSVDGGEWEALEISNWPTSFTYIESNVSLKNYAGKKIKLAIRYTSTASAAGTYETDYIKIAEGEVVEYVHIENTLETAYTTAQAKELVDNPLSILTETVFVKGTVSKVDKLNDDGSLTYWLDDDSFEVFKGLGLDGAAFESKNDIHVGDEVVVKGTIAVYNSTYEFTAGSVLAKLTSHGGEDIKDPTNTPETAYTIAQCIEMINAGANVWDLDKAVYLKGVVTKQEAYSSSKKAVSFWVRETATSTDSLEVYQALGLENTEIAENPGKEYVKVGDEVVVYGKIYLYTSKTKSIYETRAGGYIYSINGNTSGLSEVNANEESDVKEIYNILGQKVESMDAKGIYFVNGKKIIVR